MVGHTASLLLEVDEARDVDREKFDRKFRPMAAPANATTVYYGSTVRPLPLGIDDHRSAIAASMAWPLGVGPLDFLGFDPESFCQCTYGSRPRACTLFGRDYRRSRNTRLSG